MQHSLGASQSGSQGVPLRFARLKALLGAGGAGAGAPMTPPPGYDAALHAARKAIARTAFPHLFLPQPLPVITDALAALTVEVAALRQQVAAGLQAPGTASTPPKSPPTAGPTGTVLRLLDAPLTNSTGQPLSSLSGIPGPAPPAFLDSLPASTVPTPPFTDTYAPAAAAAAAAAQDTQDVAAAVHAAMTVAVAGAYADGGIGGSYPEDTGYEQPSPLPDDDEGGEGGEGSEDSGSLAQEPTVLGPLVQATSSTPPQQQQQLLPVSQASDGGDAVRRSARLTKKTLARLGDVEAARRAGVVPATSKGRSRKSKAAAASAAAAASSLLSQASSSSEEVAGTAEEENVPVGAVTAAVRQIAGNVAATAVASDPVLASALQKAQAAFEAAMAAGGRPLEEEGDSGSGGDAAGLAALVTATVLGGRVSRGGTPLRRALPPSEPGTARRAATPPTAGRGHYPTSASRRRGGASAARSAGRVRGHNKRADGAAMADTPDTPPSSSAEEGSSGEGRSYRQLQRSSRGAGHATSAASTPRSAYNGRVAAVNAPVDATPEASIGTFEDESIEVGAGGARLVLHRPPSAFANHRRPLPVTTTPTRGVNAVAGAKLALGPSVAAGPPPGPAPLVPLPGPVASDGEGRLAGAKRPRSRSATPARAGGRPRVTAAAAAAVAEGAPRVYLPPSDAAAAATAAEAAGRGLAAAAAAGAGGKRPLLAPPPEPAMLGRGPSLPAGAGGALPPPPPPAPRPDGQRSDSVFPGLVPAPATACLESGSLAIESSLNGAPATFFESLGGSELEAAMAPTAPTPKRGAQTPAAAAAGGGAAAGRTPAADVAALQQLLRESAAEVPQLQPTPAAGGGVLGAGATPGTGLAPLGPAATSALLQSRRYPAVAGAAAAADEGLANAGAVSVSALGRRSRPVLLPPGAAAAAAAAAATPAAGAATAGRATRATAATAAAAVVTPGEAITAGRRTAAAAAATPFAAGGAEPLEAAGAGISAWELGQPTTTPRNRASVGATLAVSALFGAASASRTPAAAAAASSFSHADVEGANGGYLASSLPSSLQVSDNGGEGKLPTQRSSGSMFTDPEVPPMPLQAAEVPLPAPVAPTLEEAAPPTQPVALAAVAAESPAATAAAVAAVSAVSAYSAASSVSTAMDDDDDDETEDEEDDGGRVTVEEVDARAHPLTAAAPWLPATAASRTQSEGGTASLNPFSALAMGLEGGEADGQGGRGGTQAPAASAPLDAPGAALTTSWLDFAPHGPSASAAAPTPVGTQVVFRGAAIRSAAAGAPPQAAAAAPGAQLFGFRLDPISSSAAVGTDDGEELFASQPLLPGLGGHSGGGGAGGNRRVGRLHASAAAAATAANAVLAASQAMHDDGDDDGVFGALQAAQGSARYGRRGGGVGAAAASSSFLASQSYYQPSQAAAATLAHGTAAIATVATTRSRLASQATAAGARATAAAAPGPAYLVPRGGHRSGASRGK